MDRMELVEILREKTGCSYSEAKAALEASGDDLLDALCWLEQHNKTQLTGVSCSTEEREVPPIEEPVKEKPPKKKGPVARGFQSLWDGLVSFIRKCNQTELVMTSKNGKREVGIPLTLFIILLLVAFWVVVALLVVALFFGNRFSVEGDLHRETVNEALGKATDFVEELKEDFRNDDDSEA